MSVSVDRHAYAALSTAEVPAKDAFAYWREVISATIVRLMVEPVGKTRSAGGSSTCPAATSP